MVSAYVLMTVEAGKEREIFKKIKELKEITEANELYGEWDIIAKIEVKKFEELDKIISEKLRTIDGIKVTSTMIVAEYIR